MAVVKESGIPFQVVLYGKPDQRPDRAALQSLVSLLEGPVEDLVRKDKAFKALGLEAGAYVDNPAAVVDVLDAHIDLLQRPVLVYRGRAIIGRPKDCVAPFLG